MSYWNNVSLEQYRSAIHEIDAEILGQATDSFWDSFYYQAEPRPDPELAARDFRNNRFAYQVRGAYPMSGRRTVNSLERAGISSVRSEIDWLNVFNAVILITLAALIFGALTAFDLNAKSLILTIVMVAFSPVACFVAYKECKEEGLFTDWSNTLR